jgi:hypothetical protein
MRTVSRLAIEMTVGAWQLPETSDIKMDSKLCGAFAEILDKELWEPHLGCATTKQLLDEISARSNLNYRTINDIARDICPTDKIQKSPHICNCEFCRSPETHFLGETRSEYEKRTSIKADW